MKPDSFQHHFTRVCLLLALILSGCASGLVSQPTAAPTMALPTVYVAPASTSTLPPATTAPTTVPTPTSPAVDTPLPPANTPAAPLSTATSLAEPPTLQAAEPGVLINPLDHAQLVPVLAGKFLMGSEPGQDRYFWGAEGPAHNVTLKAFAIYKTEVTNAMYQACAADHACPLPAHASSKTRKDYYTDPEYANYPVVYV